MPLPHAPGLSAGLLVFLLASLEVVSQAASQETALQKGTGVCGLMLSLFFPPAENADALYSPLAVLPGKEAAHVTTVLSLLPLTLVCCLTVQINLPSQKCLSQPLLSGRNPGQDTE